VSPTADKIRPLAAAIAWRRAVAGPVVFTNGVFDLLHPGHVELLEAARREGAALIVGVNSDAAERARARVLAGLAAVDCVVLFDDDTPLALVQALEPEVLVKGADYSRENIVGADWVEARGGRVVRVPLLAGFSTSALVERLRAPS
jgi:rfaE bifunctional protein nucleotidyltransferase chain/domain